MRSCHYPGHGEARRDLAILEGRLKPEEIVDQSKPVVPITPSASVAPGEDHRYVCPQCGAKMSYDPVAHELSCQFCGYQQNEQGTQQGGQPAQVQSDVPPNPFLQLLDRLDGRTMTRKT